MSDALAPRSAAAPVSPAMTALPLRAGRQTEATAFPAARACRAAGLLLAIALALPTPAVSAPADTVPAAAAASASAPRRLDSSAAVPSAAGHPGTPPPQGIAIDLRLPADARGATDMALPVRIVLGLTLLAVLPAILVCMTAFLRIVIVLSMLRFAIGMPETPPNTVLIGLALFLTAFTMQPVLQSLNHDALQPFMQGRLGGEAAYASAARPLRAFMLRQTREQDLALLVELAKAPRPASAEDVSTVQLIPAFMLSELRAAFQIGFVILLPFLLIDLIVSSILMALGMMMMPPVTVALPIKVLLFVLVDGWNLVLKALVGSFR